CAGCYGGGIVLLQKPTAPALTQVSSCWGCGLCSSKLATTTRWPSSDQIHQSENACSVRRARRSHGPGDGDLVQIPVLLVSEPSDRRPDFICERCSRLGNNEIGILLLVVDLEVVARGAVVIVDKY